MRKDENYSLLLPHLVKVGTPTRGSIRREYFERMSTRGALANRRFATRGGEDTGTCIENVSTMPRPDRIRTTLCGAESHDGDTCRALSGQLGIAFEVCLQLCTRD